MAMASPKERFDAAVRVIHSLPKNGSFQPSHAMMLTFYGLYKQATNGPCNISRPYVWDVVGRAKWDAWNKLGNMPSEQAMLLYVEELKKIIETMPHTENVQDFIETLGNFYELIDDGTCDSPMSAVIRNNFSPKRRNLSPDRGHVNNDGISNGDSSSDSSPVRSSPLSVSAMANSHSPVIANGHEPANGTDASGDLSDDASADSGAADVTGENGTGEEVHLVPVPTKLKTLGIGGGRLPTDNDALSSDGEEFCDTSDSTVFNTESSRQQLNGVSPAAGAGAGNQRNGVNNDAVVVRGGGDFTQREARASFPSAGGVASGSFVHGQGGNFAPHSALRPDQVPGSGGAGGADGGGGPAYGLPLYVSNAGTVEQIALALVRLQQDMNSVLGRLQTLETLSLAQQQLTASRSRSASSSSHNRSRSSESSWWRPFSNFRMSTVVFLVAWPFIVHFALRLMVDRRKRLNR